MKLIVSIFVFLTFTIFADEPGELQVVQQSRQETIVMKIVTTPEDESRSIQINLPEVYKFILKNKGEISGAPFTRYFKYTQKEVVIEIGFPVKEVINGNDEIYNSHLPATLAIISVHKGPYVDVAPHYEKINNWLRVNNKSINGPSWEYYLNNPQTTTPENYLTKIVFPIK